MMKQLDQDESGMIEFKEFVRFMAKRAEEEKIMQKARKLSRFVFLFIQSINSNH